jgi:hypothetical protein
MSFKILIIHLASYILILHLRPRPYLPQEKYLSIMPSNTKEVALEDALEQVLTEKHAYFSGDPNDFDKEFPVDIVRFWHFLETTPRAEIKKLQRHADWKLQGRVCNLISLASGVFSKLSLHAFSDSAFVLVTPEDTLNDV